MSLTSLGLLNSHSLNTVKKKKDLKHVTIRELDKEITKDMKFVYASTMADILPVALESMPKAQAANS